MAFEVIVMTDDEGMSKIQPECIEAWAEDMGVAVTGVSSNPRTRPELQGHPVLSGFAGPCWGIQSPGLGY